MAQEYTIRSWKPWMDQETEELIRDNYGNYKGSATFDEYSSEPVDATFKEQPAIGDKKYGDVIEYTTKSNKTRMKFQSAQRPKEGFGSPSTPSRGYQKSPEEREGIFRCNALTNAVTISAAITPRPNDDAVLDRADKYFNWLMGKKHDENWTPTDQELESLNS